MEKKNVVLLTVIAVATLLTAMVGSTFAFFTATVDGEGNDTDIVNATTATVTATYSEGSTINVQNIAPTWSGTNTLTIKNTSSEVDIDYTIDFQTYTNSFTNLEYKLENGKGGANESSGDGITGLVEEFTQMKTDSLKGSSDNNLVKGHLAAGQSHVFTLTLQLKDTGADQNTSDGGKTFTGKLLASAQASKKTE